MSVFSDNLLATREKLASTNKEGFPRAAMAEKIGVSLPAYTNYEAGNRKPDIDTLVRIAAALHVSTDELLGYSVDKYARTKSEVERLVPYLVQIHKK